MMHTSFIHDVEFFIFIPIQLIARIIAAHGKNGRLEIRGCKLELCKAYACTSYVQELLPY